MAEASARSSSMEGVQGTPRLAGWRTSSTSSPPACPPILADYAYLEREDVTACLLYAARQARPEVLDLGRHAA